MELVEDMRGRGIYLNPYLDQELLERIYAANGRNMKSEESKLNGGYQKGSPRSDGASRNMEDSMDQDELEEEIEESVDDEDFNGLGWEWFEARRK